MTNISKTLLFFGNERLSTGFEPHGAPTLEALIKAGYKVKAVIAHHSQTHSRTKRELEIESVARVHNIPVFLPEKPADISNELAAFKAEAAVLVAYGKIIPRSVIELFPRGIINIHPSLLPLYRGPTPIEQVLRDGVQKTGVSLMRLGEGMDTGPVYIQKELALTGAETKHELTARALQLGSELLIENLPSILDGSLAPTPQDNSKASYTSLLTKNDGQLAATRPADALERDIRAFETWPKAKLTLFGKPIVVLKARVVANKADNALVIACANNTYLEIQELVGPSGKTMQGADFIRGYAASG